MNTDRRNVYVCSEGHATWTIDVDEGVTPFMIPCQIVDCEEDATSGFYNVAHTTPRATHEWYRPGWWERLWLGHNSKDHVRQGGLLLRTIT